MFVHLVLVKLKTGVTRDDPRIKEWEAMVAAMPKKVAGITRWEYGWNTTDRPVAYDFGVNSGFATRGDLDAYGQDAYHQEVVRRQREFADWVICDYEIGEWVSD